MRAVHPLGVCCIVVVCLSYATVSLGQITNKKIKRFAIVIGNNSPDDPSQATLHYADDDAVAIHQLFLEVGVRSTLLASPDPETVEDYVTETTTARNPTLETLFEVFEKKKRNIEVYRRLGYETSFIIYYSGHGDVWDGEGYVVLANGRLTQSILLEDIIAESPADTNHVFIDACKSYFMVFNKGPSINGKRERIPFVSSFNFGRSGRNLERTGLVLSASSYRDSHEWERFQAGVFSYEVRSALRGGADADGNGEITYGELGAFLNYANKEVPPPFRPDFFVRPPGGPPVNLEHPLLTWRESTSVLTVDTGELGHIYVETPTGIRIVDAHPGKTQTLTLRLPKERPLFVRTADDKKEGILYDAKPTRLSILPLQQPGMGEPTFNRRLHRYQIDMLEIYNFYAILGQIDRNYNKYPVTAKKGSRATALDYLFAAPFSIASVEAYKERYKARLIKKEYQKDDYVFQTIFRRTLFGTAIGSLCAGGLLTSLALQIQVISKEVSHKERVRRNEIINRYYFLSIASYSIAVAAGASWLALLLNPPSRRRRSRSISVLPMVSPTGFHLGLSGQFGN
jgi:hypothetical protein